jgi:hypothetical protein
VRRVCVVDLGLKMKGGGVGGWFWGVSLWVGWFGADEGGGSRFRRMRMRRDWFML